MTSIDAIRINFNPDQLALLNACLAFIMFGVALDLRVGNFRDLLKRPKAALVGLSSQLLLLPALTLLLIFWYQPAPSIALGMLMVSACPGGNVSNFAVHLSGANTALSVFMTSASTLMAVIVTPMYFTLLAPLVPGTESLPSGIYVSPMSMVSTIVQLILVPLALGMGVYYRFPKVAGVLKKPIRALSMLIFIGFVVVAVYANYDNMLNYLHIVFLIVLSHNALALLSGYLWATFNGLPKADARAISIETGIQNSGLALILIFNFFDGLGGMALVAAFWGVWHLISAFTVALWWHYRPITLPSASS